jgi:hypothetical protein
MESTSSVDSMGESLGGSLGIIRILGLGFLVVLFSFAIYF